MTRRHRGQPSSLSYVLTTVTAAASAMTILPTVQSRAGSSPFVNTESQQVLGTPFTARIDDEEVTTSAGALYSNCDDLSYITGPMYEADADMNGFLDKEEYVEFTNTLSAGYLTIQGWDDGFTDMPLSLQETYLVLSCLCELYPNEPWGGKGCCESDPGIRTDGTAPGEILDEEQRQYLTYVCEPMSESLEDVGALVVPPTRAPVMTDMPTTEIPTKSPTLEQTKKPTELVRALFIFHFIEMYYMILFSHTHLVYSFYPSHSQRRSLRKHLLLWCEYSYTPLFLDDILLLAHLTSTILFSVSHFYHSLQLQNQPKIQPQS